LFMHHRVARHPPLEVLHLRRVRQFAVEQEEADLEMVRLVGKLFDRVAAVEKFPEVAVDIGDGAVAGGGGGEAGVIGEDLALAVKLADVADIGPGGRSEYRQLDRGVSEAQGRGLLRFGHDASLSWTPVGPYSRRKIGVTRPRRGWCAQAVAS